MAYLHLRTHSAYSLSEGAITVKQLISRTKELGMGAVALTDTNNLFGALEFATTAKKEGIQPIIGAQVSVTSVCEEGETDTLVLLAISDKGYRHLIKIVSHMYLKGKVDDIPQISMDMIEQMKWSEDLIALSGGIGQGALHKLVAKGRINESRQYLNRMKSLFEDRFYIEIMRQKPMTRQKIEEEEATLDLAFEMNIPIVATNEAFFMDQSMHEAHDALLCIAEGTYVGVQDRRRASHDCYLKSSEEMSELFKDLPEALENTINIAKRCHFLLEPIKTIFPKYACSEGRTEAEELRFQSECGLENRLEVILQDINSEEEKASIRKTYFDQLNYELGIIENMQFPGYFLVVADFIKWAKSQNIPVGPGRGSGAGSVVAWSLTITDPDPIKFGLFFERFLNPERVSMPDFDIDFCQTRRDEVIKYVQEKYGSDRVAHIITFGKLQARAVIRDVGRVLQMPYGQVDKISKLIPNNPQKPVTLPEAIEIEPLLQEAKKKDETVAHLIKIATQLEGLYRHASTHAAGVVIGDRPLDEMVALYHDPRSPLPATQFNMKYVEDAGLIKFDFLGLKTLTVIQKTCDLLKKRGIEVDIGHIPYDDPKTFELLRNVETVGVFQVESGGMGDVLRRLKPDRLEEIVALVALYRPGPMDYIPQYIARRHGEEEVSYMYAELEPILAETFGVIVYQEQVLQIARDLAGYTLGGADSLRRAMGKKIKAEMDMHRKTFIDGVIAKTGGSAEKASALFDQIDKFASYAFNKAHAVAYGIIAYQTAYLKAHYPVEFMAATMSLDTHNTDKLVSLSREVNRLKIPLLPPDVNKSLADFGVEENSDGVLGVRYALAALKNVGEGAMEALVAEREAHGEFKNIFEFVERVDQKILNKRLMENLIGAGSFDTISNNRKLLLSNLEMLLKYPSKSKSQPAGLFGVEETRPKLTECSEFSPFDKLKHEFAAIGFYVSGHPLDAYEDYLKKIGVSNYALAIEKAATGQSYQKIAGVLATIQEKTSKSGNRYAFLQMSDPTGAYEVTVFSDTLAANRDILIPGNSLLLDVNIETKDDMLRTTCNGIKRLDAMAEDAYEMITIDIDPKSVNLQEIINQINSLQTGSSEIRLSIKNGGFSSTISIDGGKRIPSETIAIWKQMNGLSLEVI